MRLIKYLPRILHRHKTIEILVNCGLQNKIVKVLFNNSSQAFLDLSDPEPRNVFLTSEFERDFFKIAQCFVSAHSVFFDLGANYGLCTFGLMPKLSTAKFHLFEANEKLVKIISMSVKLYPDSFIKINNVCISDQEGETKFHLEKKQTGQSHVATYKEDGISVQNLLLDEYCKRESIKTIDFAKIDLEGHELKSLKGWNKYINDHRVKALYLEIVPENQNRYGLRTIAPLQFLESCGYKLYLCKQEDVKYFGKESKLHVFNNQKLMLSSFISEEYPNNYATDVLALAPQD